MKACSNCKEVKEESEFYIKKNGQLYAQCKDCKNKQCKDYRARNYEIVRAKKIKYVQENKEHIKKLNEGYREAKKEYYRELGRKTYHRNKEKFNRINAIKHSIRIKEDPQYRIKKNMRRRVNDFMKGKNRSKRTLELLRCDFEFFIKYLESKFTEGMTVEKLSTKELHLDHIRPIASFNLMDEEDLKKCFHYTNYQPLWPTENISKGAKYYETI